MNDTRISLIASGLVVGVGILWGLYWLPVRMLDDQGLSGAWGTLALAGAAACLLAPVVALRRRRIERSDLVAIGAVALGGAAFALYSIGFVYGRVAIIILLFYLTPVWSTLIARVFMGWQTPPMRLVAIVIGLAGLGVMLGAQGQAPIPRNTGEWMALASGILWAVSNTGIRSRSRLEPAEAAFWFSTGASLTALILAPLLAPWPAQADPSLGVILAAGALFWGLSIAGLLWAARHLDPARVGILLMSEIVIGILSAAVIAGETLTPLEIAGGALVLASGLVELWPVKPKVLPRA